MCYLGREETETLNEVNVVTGSFSPRCLPEKIGVVHTCTKIGKKPIFFHFAGHNSNQRSTLREVEGVLV